jgi:hypothetical protein
VQCYCSVAVFPSPPPSSSTRAALATIYASLAGRDKRFPLLRRNDELALHSKTIRTKRINLRATDRRFDLRRAVEGFCLQAEHVLADTTSAKPTNSCLARPTPSESIGCMPVSVLSGWLSSTHSERRENKIRVLGVGRLCLPMTQMLSQNAVQRNIAVRRSGFRFSVFSLGPALRHPNPCLSYSMSARRSARISEAFAPPDHCQIF